MKKIIIALMVLCASISTASAQQFGVRAGVNVLNMSTNFGNVMSGDNRSGFYVGPTVKFTLPIVGLGVDASLLYDQRTAKVSVEEVGTETLTSRVIAIPVNARYGVGLGSMANVFLFAGPQVAFNLSKDKKFFGPSDWTWKKSQFSVNVGIGVTVLSKLEVKANYNIACGNTGDASYKEYASQVATSFFKSKYNSWQIGAAYYF